MRHCHRGGHTPNKVLRTYQSEIEKSSKKWQNRKSREFSSKIRLKLWFLANFVYFSSIFHHCGELLKWAWLNLVHNTWTRRQLSVERSSQWNTMLILWERFSESFLVSILCRRVLSRSVMFEKSVLEWLIVLYELEDNNRVRHFELEQF